MQRAGLHAGPEVSAPASPEAGGAGEPAPGAAEAGSPRERQHRGGAWAALVTVLGLLLFTWPFLRSPRLGIGAAYAHLLGAWAAIVAALALVSRALGRAARGRGRDG